MYKHLEIEQKWQKHWDEQKSFATGEDRSKPKYFVLDMFPFPSGAGLHVGHPLGYIATDIKARFKRMQGFNVLHPMGWDAFGLPAEQYAIQTKTHPRAATEKNVGTFKRQLKSIGLSYDWDREINTTDEKYYKWTQWIFLQLHKKGLAYQAEVPVNWCPALKTVLANEEVVDGKSERGGHPVVRLPMKQWMLKITEYAERLLTDLDDVDWPDSIKEMQRNWIGRSEGALINFKLDTAEADEFTVYTTRPDTIYGVTYMVLAPEHPLVDKITTDENKAAVAEYKEAASRKSDLDRTELAKEKSGVFTGAYAINPVNGEKVPVWIADYVLIHYGTGAIMAVPHGDERDHEFAEKFGLEIKPVSDEYGVTINSYFMNGMKKGAAIAACIKHLEDKGFGEKKVNYKLRDWLFSRQRYWGEPFPVLEYEDGTQRLLEVDELPLTLPEVESYEPSDNAESPLANVKDWVNITDAKTGKPARRDTNTMPNWAGSCWYYLRYIDPDNNDAFVDPEKEKYWMPVDLYVGGAEHAVLHLLYARFWHKVLYDLGHVSTKEPFQKLFNQGMILGEDNEKMSKSRGNVINPDELIEKYGADSLRLYEMFMGPLDKIKPWNSKGIDGTYRFLQKAWRWLHGSNESDELVADAGEPPTEALKVLHKTIDKVTKDIENMHYNTAVSQLMIFINEMGAQKIQNKEFFEKFTLLLAPFAPHFAEEIWQKLGHTGSLSNAAWPKADAKHLVDDEITVAIQVNGKRRGEMKIAKDLAKDDVLAQAKTVDGVVPHIEGKNIVREIYVPGKLVNLVVK